MGSKETKSNFKGIYICEDDLFIYETFLDKSPKSGRFIARIPFEHSYCSGYMGSICFSRLDEDIWQMGHYYPLGVFPKDANPLFLGKGLSTVIEREVVSDLDLMSNGNLQIRVIANEDFRRAQLKRIGVSSGDVLMARDYLHLLDACIGRHPVASLLVSATEREVRE